MCADHVGDMIRTAHLILGSSAPQVSSQLRCIHYCSMTNGLYVIRLGSCPLGSCPGLSTDHVAMFVMSMNNSKITYCHVSFKTFNKKWKINLELYFINKYLIKLQLIYKIYHNSKLFDQNQNKLLEIDKIIKSQEKL